MALVQCRECSKQISDKASACPHCGAPAGKAAPKDGAEKTAPGLVGLVFLGGLIVYAMSSCSGPDKPKTEQTVTAEQECKADDLKCLGDKLVVAAGVYCQAPIEHLATHSVKWTDGTFEMKFSHFRWADKAAGSVTMIGDKAEFQNGFGAYTPVIYECDLAKDGKTVLDVRVREGRLPL